MELYFGIACNHVQIFLMYKEKLTLFIIFYQEHVVFSLKASRPRSLTFYVLLFGNISVAM